MLQLVSPYYLAANMLFQQLLLSELALAAALYVHMSGAQQRHGLSRHATDTGETVAGKSAAGKTAAAAKGGKNNAKVQLPRCTSLSLCLCLFYPPCFVVM